MFCTIVGAGHEAYRLSKPDVPPSESLSASNIAEKLQNEFVADIVIFLVKRLQFGMNFMFT